MEENTTKQTEQFEYVKHRMEEEGFDYCFQHYSTFDEIEDEKFHQLRENYIKAAKQLEEYINNKIYYV